MKNVIRIFFIARFRGLFIYIPIGFLPAVIVWFFVHVLLGNPFDFVDGWKWAYVVLNMFDLVLALFGMIVLIASAILLSRQYKSSFEDVIEARMVHKLHKQNDYMDWTPEQFAEFLSISRMSLRFAETIVGTMKKSI